MKIKECSVIDNKVIDELMAECMHPAIYEVLEYIKSHSKPLEPIVRDVYFKQYLYELTPADFEDYINETDI
jgi:hypothetical protein